MSSPWNQWLAQTAAIMRLELRKSFLNRRAWWIYLLALGPVFVTGMHSLSEMRRSRADSHFAEDYMIYAGIFQFFYLRLGVFFGCLGIFSNLIRGEVLNKTLHYYLLAPVRREVILFAKYLTGLLAAVVLFAGSAAASFILISYHSGPELQEFLFKGPGLGQLGWYTTVAALACLGYGSVFLIMGLVFANPMVPAAVLMVWEAINGFLPALLKKFSIIFYLKSLCPFDMPEKFQGPLALLAIDAEPVTPSVAIFGLLWVSAVVLYLAGRKVRKVEISYSE